MKIRVKVVATKSMVIDSDKWNDICAEDGEQLLPFDEFSIQQYVKGCLIEDLRNDPNRGTYNIEILED